MTVNDAALLAGLIGVVTIQRVFELRLARRNTAWARARGAREFGARHHAAFFVLHAAWLVAWVAEAWANGPRLDPHAPAWLLLFVAALVLRASAIAALGPRWNTRILVIPGMPPVRRGPYRVLRHPNYVAVVVELAALPLAFGAVVTAVLFGALNLSLLLCVRIPAEEDALEWAAHEGGVLDLSARTA